MNIDLTKVFPRIKAVFTDENPDPAPAMGGMGPGLNTTYEESPVFQNLTKNVAVFYALDRGDSYQLLQNKHLSENLTINDLHQAAIRNMAEAVGDQTELKGDPANIMMLVNGGNFEAAMLLADALWEEIQSIFEGPVCVAIPAKDLLFITAKNNPIGRENLRKTVRRFFEEPKTQGLLVRHVYEREDGGWKYMETI